MSTKKFDFKKAITWLGYILRCPICGFRYNLQATRVIESEQNEALGEARLLIHSDCQKCKSSVMFNIDINGPEVFSVGMVTDLTGKDSAKFSKLSAISADDVINLHTALGEFDGNFVKTLSSK